MPNDEEWEALGAYFKKSEMNTSYLQEGAITGNK